VPRKYSMQARSTAVEETRQRIVDATVELHNEQGISGTSMQDVADRAGVALATVYRHFPSLDELIPACGGRNLELNPPPTAAVFDGLETGEQRIAALVAALHANYERGSRSYEVAIAEVHTIPVLARFMAEVSAHLADLVATAAKPFKPDSTQLKLAVGLCDFLVWRALTATGMTTKETTAAITRLLCASLGSGTNGNRGKA